MKALKSLAIVALAGLLISAAYTNPADSNTRYAIHGDVEGLTGKVYLYAIEKMNTPFIVDSTETANGAFSFTGETKNAVRAFFKFEKFPELYVRGGFFLDGSDIKINGDTVLLEGNYASSLNKLYDEYFAKEQSIMSGRDKNPNAGEEIFSLRQKTMSDNLDNELGAYIFCFFESYYRGVGEIDSILALFPSGLHSNSVYLKQVADTNDKKRKLSEGMPYIDIALPAPDGETVSLSSLLKDNKYVLIDFWASWCGPCIGEIPGMKKLYNDFKDLGFSIYGVSLDTDRSNWLKAMETHGLEWTNVSSLSRDCPAKLSYMVTAIPSTFLISSDGIIIKANIRSEELHGILSTLLILNSQ